MSGIPSQEIVLASASPRRRELLAAIGLRVAVRPVAVDETPLPGEAPADYVARLALEKAASSAASLTAPVAAIIAADTAVVLGREIFGKPGSETEFRRMIGKLSGKTHHVYTAVVVHSAGRSSLRVVTTEVSLRHISEQESKAYWDSGEPRDKAGGYAVQGLGAVFVSAIRGSHSAVVGLPLFETAALLAEAGIDPLLMAAGGELREG